MILPNDTLRRYNQSRSNTYKALVCHAPTVNLNFEQNGNVRACCYNREQILGRWPEQSIKEIWTGEKANELRSYIQNNNLGGGCRECGKMIEVGNYQGVRARYYDEFAPDMPQDKVSRFVNKLSGKLPYPKVMEFEISNECNLECVMCNGSFSSSIRKNREKLPPIFSPYNETFVDELEEFIPHLTDAKFLGGEPFMIDLYLSIWDRILRINPKIRMHITTNGTFLNRRIKDLLEGLNAGIIVSMDSVNRTTYPKIRVNGNYDKVMENLDYFLDYTKRKKTFISIAACPIVHNWRELPEMLEFCLERNIALYFNAVFTPFELSLREQTIDLQREILHYLTSYKLPDEKTINTSPRRLSVNAFNDFINQLRGWLAEREAVLAQKEKIVRRIEAGDEGQGTRDDKQPATTSTVVGRLTNDMHWSEENVLKAITAITAIEGKGLFEDENSLKVGLGALVIAAPPGKLYETLNCYLLFQERYDNTTIPDVSRKNLEQFAEVIDSHPKRDQIIGHLSTLSPLFFAKWICDNSFESMRDNLLVFFN